MAGAGLPVQVGGGYRTPELVEAALAAGAARVLVGTAALDDTFLASAVGALRRPAGGRDRRPGRPRRDPRLDAQHGRNTGRARRTLRRAGRLPPGRHGTHRDGTLTGPDLELLEEIVCVGLPTIAAGGIATLDDLRALRRLGCEGAVVGSALWLDRLTIADALSVEDASQEAGKKN